MVSIQFKAPPSARLRPLSMALILALSAPAFAVVPTPSFTNVHTTPNQATGAQVTQTFTLAHPTANIAGGAAQAQVETLTITGAVTAGDQYSVSLPGPHVATYTAQSGDTPTEVAAGLNTAIQGTTGYGAQAFTTGASSGVVTFTATVAGTGFTLTSPTYTAAAGGGSATYENVTTTPAVAPTAQEQTLTITGTVGTEVFTVTLPDVGAGAVPVTYTASGFEDGSAVAAALVAQITGSAGYASQAFTVVNLGNTITFTEKASGNGAGFSLTGIGPTIGGVTLDSSITRAASSASTPQEDTLTIGGSVSVGDVFSVTLPVGSVVVDYTAVSGDTPSSVAIALNSAIQANNGDYTAQPFTSNRVGSTIVFTEKVSHAGAGFTLTRLYTPIAAGGSALNDLVTTANSSGSSAQAQVDTLTVGGSVDTGDVYSIVLPGPVTATYTAAASDTPTLVAAGLNTAIQNSAGYGSQPFTTAAASGVVTFTAKVAGTGWTLGAASSTNAAAVAQIDTLTPAGVTVGESYAVTIGSSVYVFVATDTSANTVVSNLTTAINNDGASPVTASGTSTLILTAKVPGTAFTSSAAVAGAATAGNSTLAVGSNSLTVGGATTTATLTLKDASSGALFNVSGSGATITSDSASCTIGSFTRSSTNGTVTATITAASAGSCTIGATLDGTAGVTATQTVTVSAATPAADPTPAPTVINSGSGTIPSGGIGTVTGISTVTVGSGSSLNISSSGASGSTVTLPSGSMGVSIDLGGSSTVTVSTGSSGTILGVVSGGTGQGNGLTLVQGSATVSSPQGGTSLLTVTGVTTPIITGASGGALIGSANGNGSITVQVTSGSVKAPNNCGTRPSVPTTPRIGSPSSAWNAYFNQVTSYQNALLSYSLCITEVASDNIVRERAVARASVATAATLTLYKGESIVYDNNGNVTGTSLVDGGAGAAQSLTLPTGLSLESVPVSIDGTPARLNGANLGGSVVSALAAQLGTPLTRASNSSIGGFVAALADGSLITGVPVGQLQVAPGAASGLQPNGLAQIVASGVVVNLAPSLANPAALVSQIKSLDAQATATVMANGLLKVTVGGSQYIVRPAWTATPSTANGFSTDAAGNLVFGDSKLQQTLHPAFADLNKVAAVLSTIAGVSAPVQAADGSVSVTVGSNTLTLRAGYQLISRPVAHTDDLWWVDGGTLYLNYMDGTAQAFTVQ